MDRLFQPQHQDIRTRARNGILYLAHGPVETPAFMPVGTAGTVKAVDHDTLHEMGYRLILANTYHLYLRPGADVIRSHGGLHNFSTWTHNFLTDSGGFQVFSLSAFRKIREEGAEFQSHIDGSRHLLTPESVVEFQALLGSDIQMALDVCTGAGAHYQEAKEAMERTLRWGTRATRAWQSLDTSYQGVLFPIVQGNFFKDLRTESANRTVEMDLPGIAIGGLSVGESFAEFEETLSYTVESLPKELPKYVMGIGTPEYVLSAVRNGVDMFDCVFPTRAGRTATLFTRNGRINLRNAQWAHSDDPPDPGFDSFGGRTYSLGYLRHLFKSNEILGAMLATQHNLRFLYWLMKETRSAIREDRFDTFERGFLARYQESKL